MIFYRTNADNMYPFGEPLIAIWCDGYNFVAAVAVADLLECC
jgi:hypothetical protein